MTAGINTKACAALLQAPVLHVIEFATGSIIFSIMSFLSHLSMLRCCWTALTPRCYHSCSRGARCDRQRLHAQAVSQVLCRLVAHRDRGHCAEIYSVCCRSGCQFTLNVQSTSRGRMVCRLMIHTDDRPELDDPDEFYAQDLVGLEVRLPLLHLCASFVPGLSVTVRPWLEVTPSGKGSERSGIMLCVDCTLYPGTGAVDSFTVAAGSSTRSCCRWCCQKRAVSATALFLELSATSTQALGRTTACASTWQSAWYAQRTACWRT